MRGGWKTHYLFTQGEEQPQKPGQGLTLQLNQDLGSQPQTTTSWRRRPPLAIGKSSPMQGQLLTVVIHLPHSKGKSHLIFISTLVG